MILINILRANLLIIYFLGVTSLFSTPKKEVNFKNKKVINSDTNNIKADYIYKDLILKSNIKTLLCHQKKQILSQPIINLKSNEIIEISFDDLDEGITSYYYSLIHCNSDWTKSDLMESEYIDGFFTNEIINYQLSFNTIQQYTHYNFTFPNNDTKIMLSGNYVFKIFQEDGNVIAYKRFMVLENKVTIIANVKRGTLIKNRKNKHEIDFEVNHSDLYISDPFTDIKVIIKQNNNEENQIKDLIPIFIQNNILKYDYDDDNNFEANNEFRYFDFKSLRYLSEKIKHVKYDSTKHINQVYLYKDQKRSFDLYSIYPDINGKFIIDSQEGRNSSIEADYAEVYFRLDVEQTNYGEIYLFGSFSDWQIKDDFKLNYNYQKKQYETNIYLKQGYYNYHYALKDTIENKIDFSFIEGSHYETKNDYYIYIYYRGTEDRSDRLIGYLKTSSKALF